MLFYSVSCPILTAFDVSDSRSFSVSAVAQFETEFAFFLVLFGTNYSNKMVSPCLSTTLAVSGGWQKRDNDPKPFHSYDNLSSKEKEHHCGGMLCCHGLNSSLSGGQRILYTRYICRNAQSMIIVIHVHSFCWACIYSGSNSILKRYGWEIQDSFVNSRASFILDTPQPGVGSHRDLIHILQKMKKFRIGWTEATWWSLRPSEQKTSNQAVLAATSHHISSNMGSSVPVLVPTSLKGVALQLSWFDTAGRPALYSIVFRNGGGLVFHSPQGVGGLVRHSPGGGEVMFSIRPQDAKLTDEPCSLIALKILLGKCECINGRKFVSIQHSLHSGREAGVSLQNKDSSLYLLRKMRCMV